MMSKWRSLSSSKSGAIVRAALLAVAAICARQVLFGRRPWETGIGVAHAEGKPALLEDYMASGFWYAALFVGVVALALVLTSRFWLNLRNLGEVKLSRGGEGEMSRRTFWVVLGLVLVAAIVPRIARMGHSLWGDEDWAYRDLVGGRYSVAEDGAMKFKRHPWATTIFWDKSTNNQYLYTISARACLDGWRKITGAPPQAFSEAALRLPSLVAGLASIAAGALLLARLGFARAGLLLAALMAAHPWHLRYSSEARGYAMLILFLLAAIYFLIGALERGRWREWLMFGLMQFCALYTWKAAIHPVAALNLGVFLVVWRTRGTGSGRGQLIWRWLVTNALVMMVFIPLFAPAIPQIQRKLEVSTQAHGKMGVEWFQNVFGQLLSGTDSVGVSPLSLWVVAPLAALFVVVGVWRLRRSESWWLIVAPVAGSAFAFAHFSLSNNELLKWYVFYVLPFLLALIALGVEFSGRRLASFRWAPAAGFLALYLFGNAGVLRERIIGPIQHSREAAEVTRNAAEGLLQMGATDIITVGLYRASHSYDPRMRQSRELRTGEALLAVVEECRASGKDLHVSAANLGFARANDASFFAVLEDPALFRKTGDFPAAEDYLRIETYQMLPESGE